jgi:hypothetical protein
MLSSLLNLLAEDFTVFLLSIKHLFGKFHPRFFFAELDHAIKISYFNWKRLSFSFHQPFWRYFSAFFLFPVGSIMGLFFIDLKVRINWWVVVLHLLEVIAVTLPRSHFAGRQIILEALHVLFRLKRISLQL